MANEQIVQIIRKLEGEWGGAAPLERVYETASSRGFRRADVENIIQNLKQKGFAYSPTSVHVALAVDPKIPHEPEPTITCDDVERTIKKHGYIVRQRMEIPKDTKDQCVIDFVHPKVRVEEPVFYYVSSVHYNKPEKKIEVTVRSKVDDYKELFLDYCCESDKDGCYQRCRPHVNMKDKILSCSAIFHENPLKKFDRLLEEMR